MLSLTLPYFPLPINHLWTTLCAISTPWHIEKCDVPFKGVLLPNQATTLTTWDKHVTTTLLAPRKSLLYKHFLSAVVPFRHPGDIELYGLFYLKSYKLKYLPSPNNLHNGDDVPTAFLRCQPSSSDSTLVKRSQCWKFTPSLYSDS